MFLVKAQNGSRYALKRMYVNNDRDLAVCQKEIKIAVSTHLLVMIAHNYPIIAITSYWHLKWNGFVPISSSDVVSPSVLPSQELVIR